MANVGRPGTIDGLDVDAAVTIRFGHERPWETHENATGLPRSRPTVVTYRAL